MAADNRPSWDEYFMKMANDVATRTTCLRRGVGAVIVKDRRILATGYNITGASIYVNTQPCVVCAKMLINAGIEEIVYQNPYPDELSQELLAESGILVREYTGE